MTKKINYPTENNTSELNHDSLISRDSLLATLDREMQTLMRWRERIIQDIYIKEKSPSIKYPSLENYYSMFNPLEPAVPIDQSVHDDYLICLEDGEQVVLLQSYIMRRYKMDPLTYKRRWRLPHNYPMIPKNYQNKRQKIAQEYGLGKDHAIRRGRKSKNATNETKNPTQNPE